MRFIEETEDRPPEVNVVALIDVIFAVLTFFILSSLSLSRTEGLSVNLPIAGSGKSQEQTKMVVTVDRYGAIALNRQPVELTHLVPKLQSLIDKNKSNLVIINADTTVEHGQIVAIMDKIHKIPSLKLAIATKPK